MKEIDGAKYKFRAWNKNFMVDVVSINFLNQYIT
jgi:hypothetical protein